MRSVASPPRSAVASGLLAAVGGLRVFGQYPAHAVGIVEPTTFCPDEMTTRLILDCVFASRNLPDIGCSHEPIGQALNSPYVRCQNNGSQRALPPRKQSDHVNFPGFVALDDPERTAFPPQSWWFLSLRYHSVIVPSSVNRKSLSAALIFHITQPKRRQHCGAIVGARSAVCGRGRAPCARLGRVDPRASQFGSADVGRPAVTSAGRRRQPDIPAAVTLFSSADSVASRSKRGVTAPSAGRRQR